MIRWKKYLLIRRLEGFGDPQKFRHIFKLKYLFISFSSTLSHIMFEDARERREGRRRWKRLVFGFTKCPPPGKQTRRPWNGSHFHALNIIIYLFSESSNKVIFIIIYNYINNIYRWFYWKERGTKLLLQPTTTKDKFQ